MDLVDGIGTRNVTVEKDRGKTETAPSSVSCHEVKKDETLFVIGQCVLLVMCRDTIHATNISRVFSIYL